ncbi:MAG: MBL fold metallo-hydrolase [Rhodocyclaceae bacterium]|nr:MBL fold metallo-hydrolase [Rhodocyclaceae bacterium]
MDQQLQIEGFYDQTTGTVSYLALDRANGRCALVDPVLDFDHRSGRTATTGVDRLIARVAELGAQVEWILETHAHADHLSAAPYLRGKLGGRIAIGAQITAVQRVFAELFHAGPDFATDGSQFDHLFADGETFSIGSLRCRAIHTPGHTPACMSYLVDHDETLSAFVGDTLFMPDYGTARCDFPGGDARSLYRSIRRLLALPPETRLCLCHDYRPDGRPAAWLTTVAEQRRDNVHVHDDVGEDDFVAMRTARDAGLDMPTLMLPSIQVNMRAGQLPPAEANGTRYLKIPLDRL